MIRYLYLTLLFSLLSGCATQYQSSGLTGGYYEIPGPGKMEKIFFSGNGFIKSEEVQNYAMYRIAEVAQTKGKQYFLIYQSLSAAAREIPATQPIVGAMGNKPTAYAFVLFLDKEQKGAFNTEKVLKDLAWIKQPVDQIRVKNQ